MGKLKLVIVGETSYVGRLANYIQKNGPDYLELTMCRDEAELTGLVKHIQPDILLCEQLEVLQNKALDQAIRILLSDTGCMGTDTLPSIFRYQHGTEILRQIFLIYGQKAEKDLACWYRKDCLEMAAIYAPGGHELHLPFSMAYTALCGQKKKTLFLNLSEFSGMLSLLGEQEGEGFSDLIYGIRQKKERFAVYFQSVLHHTEQFDYIQPPGNPQDLYEIQEEDMVNLLSFVAEQTEYESIVWHLGIWNQLTEQILKKCGKIFCVVKESSFGKYRKKELGNFLEQEARKEFQKKIRYVCPQNGNGGVFLQGTALLSQLLMGEFADQVRKMTED